MKLMGHFLTFLITITVVATGGYYFLQQRYVKQLEVETLQKNLLSREDKIDRLEHNLGNQQEVVERNKRKINQQLALYVKDTELLVDKVNKWKDMHESELKRITEVLTLFQKANKAELAALEEKSQTELNNLSESIKAEIHNSRKDHIKIVRSLQNQIIIFTDRYIEKNKFFELFNSALKFSLTHYESVNADLGSLPSGRPQKIIKDIPTSIPNEAREILIYAYIATSYVRGERHSFKISVQPSESKEAAFYLYSIANMQQEWSYNSDNFWLPMPTNRKIFLETTGSPLFGSWESRVKIIAYR